MIVNLGQVDAHMFTIYHFQSSLNVKKHAGYSDLQFKGFAGPNKFLLVQSVFYALN